MAPETPRQLHEVAVEIASQLREGDFDEARRLLSLVGLTKIVGPRRKVLTSGPAKPIDRIVFICGVHRSGTTLLADHLASRYQVGYFPKGIVPEAEGQHLQNVYPGPFPFGPAGAFAFYPQMRPGPVRNPVRAWTKARRLKQQWGRRLIGDSRILLEKSPSNTTRIAYLRSLYPKNSKFILWTQDPRAVACATQKWVDMSLDALMMNWNAAYLKAIDELDGDCIIKSYEEFCDHPEETMGEIAAFCDLTPRAKRIGIESRFEDIKNTNPDYISTISKLPDYRMKILAWELLGYSF